MFFLRSSPKYVDRLVDQLKKNLELSSRVEFSAKESINRRDQAIQEQAKLQVIKV